MTGFRRTAPKAIGVGLLVPSLHVFFEYAWFTGTLTSGVLYWALMRRAAD